jgi:hypothetical protein
MPFAEKVVVENSMVRAHRMLSVLWVALAFVGVAAVAGTRSDLIDAAQRGNAAVVQSLLAKGADVNAKANDDLTALIQASQEDVSSERSRGPCNLTSFIIHSKGREKPAHGPAFNDGAEGEPTSEASREPNGDAVGC